MQCSRCARQGMVEIRMTIAGEDVLFHSCGRCEARHWSSPDGPLSLDHVLELARADRRTQRRTTTGAGMTAPVPTRGVEVPECTEGGSTDPPSAFSRSASVRGMAPRPGA